MIQNKFILFLITSLWCFGGVVFGQCPNSYSINTQAQPTYPWASNGHIYASGTTYYAASTYLWNTGGTNRALTNIPSGNYTVTITDPTNCT